MFSTEFPAHDNRSYEWEVEIINLKNGKSHKVKVKSDEAKYAMQRAYEGYAIDMIGMTCSTLRDYYIKKYDVLVKDPERIFNK